MTEHVHVTDAAGVRTIMFNRPDKKNALTRAMYQGAADALAGGDADDAIGAILLRGAGDAFTGGNDMKDFAEAGPRDGRPGGGSPLIRQLAQMKKPLVGAVQGPAIGVGTTMLLHCDFLLVGPRARLQTPFTDLGLCPEAASSLLMPRLLGHARAARLLLAGEAIDGRQAVDWGLAMELVEGDALFDRATDLARRLAAKPRGAMIATKHLMRPSPETLLERMREEGELFEKLLVSPEAKAAFNAFLNRGRRAAAE